MLVPCKLFLHLYKKGKPPWDIKSLLDTKLGGSLYLDLKKAGGRFNPACLY
jgi:hypothetical protein